MKKKLIKYLKTEGITILDAETTENQLKKLLAIFVNDFINYKLFFDDFSSLCEKILVVLQNKKARSDPDFFMICHYGAELSWYIRNEPARAGHFLERILEYYRNYIE